MSEGGQENGTVYESRAADSAKLEAVREQRETRIKSNPWRRAAEAFADFFRDTDISLVLRGEKPGATTFDLDSVKGAKRLRKFGLEAVPINTHGKREVDNIAIAFPGTVDDVIEQRGIPQVPNPDAQAKIDGLLEHYRNTSIAQTIAQLAERDLRGLETAEGAAATGLLFGYKLCNIEYYIRTNFLGEPHDPKEETDGQEVLCEACRGKA